MPITDPASARALFNKVPEITAYFWIIKVLATTVGETVADFLNESMGLGLNGTSVVMAALLAAALAVQFRANRYQPRIYWLTVVLISVVGTLVTDNLVDNLGVSLQTTTLAFSAALAAVFLTWNAVERTLSIHTIFSLRREAFYWLAILFTFALGTAAGDLLAESMDVGYARSALIFGAAIGAVALAHYRLEMNSVLAFWLAYILTRPLGASIGDLLSQPVTAGGIDLGPMLTSLTFLGVILSLVTYLTLSRVDLERVQARRDG